MRWRDFIAGLGGAAASRAVWPAVACARQPAMPVIGHTVWGAPRPNAGPAAAFQGLADAGYFDGQNVTIEYRSAGEVAMIDCRHWRPTRYVARSPPPAQFPQHLRQKLPPPQFRS